MEKNRQSARECRKRKKEYILALEEKIDEVAAQNSALRAKMGELERQNKEMEKTNKDLMEELKELRAKMATLQTTEQKPKTT